MRQQRLLIGSCVLSIIVFLLLMWSTNNTKPPTMDAPTTTSLVRAPTIIKDVLVLNDGSHSYHLNFTSFHMEFPYLQSYRCNLIQKPRPEGHGEADDKLIILAVKSHPNARGRRSALRQTWATERVIAGHRLRPVFLLGMTPAVKHMEIAKEENQEHGDILQWDLMEGHHNLSLKERCFLEWLHWNSSHVHYIFKGDDDVFVNPEMVVRYIAEHGTPNTVHGYHQHRPLVMRNTKYQISKTLYPQERYPGFVSGGGFLFPGAATKSLYEASQLLPVFPLDDVYFGFLSLAANLNFRHDPRFYVYRLDYDACRYKQALMVHNINFENLTEIWRQVQSAECRRPEFRWS